MPKGGGSSRGSGGGSKASGGSRGPGGGSLSAPSRTEASRGNTSSYRGGGGSRGPGGGSLSAPNRTEASRGIAGSFRGGGGFGSSMSRLGASAFGRSLTAPNGSYYGPKGGNALNANARMAAARSIGFSQPALQRTPGDAEMLGRMMMAESGSIRNAFGRPRTDGLQGVADVVRNRMLSERFPDTVPGVLTQRKQFSPIADGSFRRTPANPMATRIAEAVLSGEQPPVVGNALNYANIHTVNNLPGYSSSATRRAFNGMPVSATIADARNQITRSHTFGTIGRPSDVAFGGPMTNGLANGNVQVAGVGQNAVAAGARRAQQEAALRTLSGALPQPNRLGAFQGPRQPNDPTAPHLGTPTSQTAQAETAPSIWQQGSSWLADKTQAAVRAQQELKQAVETYGPETVSAYLRQKAGQVPDSIKWADSSREGGRQLVFTPKPPPAAPPVAAPETPPPPEPPPYMWRFPEYSQRWAFTPPQGSFAVPRPPVRRA